MLALLASSAIFLTASQAVINGPRNEFKACLKEASSKASNDHVAGSNFEAYVRTNCAGQIGAFKAAVVKFDMGNKMSRKASDEDADAMLADFMSSEADNYKYRTRGDSPEPVKEASAPPPAAPASSVTPPPTPASAPKPPK